MIKFKRGAEATLPSLSVGEPAICIDTGHLYVGATNGTVGINSHYITPEAYGAKGDGTTDDTAAIQAAITAARAGNRFLVFSGGKTYKTTGVLDYTNLVIFDNSELDLPATPTITNAGTAGTTSYSYKVSVILTDGTETDLSSAGTTATGNATLGAVNYNTVTHTAYSGAYAYRIWRTASGGSPTSTGLIAVQFPPTVALNDTGLVAAEGINIPTAPRSGLFSTDVIRVGPFDALGYDSAAKLGVEGSISAHGSVRATGVDDFLMKEAGVELQYVANVGHVLAFDRVAGVFRPLMLNYGNDANSPVVVGPLQFVDGVHSFIVSGAGRCIGKMDADAGFGGLTTSDAPTFVSVALSDLTAGVIPYKNAVVEKITNGDCELWASATDLSSWSEYITGTSSVNRDGADKYAGTYSCRLDSGASADDSYISQQFTLTPSGIYTLSLWYKTTAGATPGVALADSTSTVQLGAIGTWGASPIILPESTSWVKYSIIFTAHASYTNYALYLTMSGAVTNASHWFDDISITSGGVLDDSPLSTDGTDVTCSGDILGDNINQDVHTTAGPTFDHLHLTTGPISVAGTQVVGARVIDARIDDAINSGDATTDGVIDAIRDALIAHGIIAAA